MGLLKSIGDFWRNLNIEAEKASLKTADRYGVVSAIATAGDNIASVKTLVKLLSRQDKLAFLTIKNHAFANDFEKHAATAYEVYLRYLGYAFSAREHGAPFSTVIKALDTIAANLDQVENNVVGLLNPTHASEESIRLSSLIVVGYIERANTLVAWLSQFAAHVTTEGQETVTPFWTNNMISNASVVGAFVGDNLSRWSVSSGGLMKDIKTMQKQGLDAQLKKNETWFDDVYHDAQFSSSQKDLMNASLRNPFLMLGDRFLEKRRQEIELLTTRRNWLIAKVALEEARLGGISESSPEYLKLRKVVDNYTSLITQYEQKIERLRS